MFSQDLQQDNIVNGANRTGCSVCIIQNIVLLHILTAFWLGLGLPRLKAIVVIPKNQLLPKPFTEKMSKNAKYPWPLPYKKRSVEITMHLGLDNN